MPDAAIQSEAKSDLRPGGAFSMFNGTVSGTYREVEAPKRIVQDWRFNHWPEGCLSKARSAQGLAANGGQTGNAGRIQRCMCRRLTSWVPLSSRSFTQCCKRRSSVTKCIRWA